MLQCTHDAKHVESFKGSDPMFQLFPTYSKHSTGKKRKQFLVSFLSLGALQSDLNRHVETFTLRFHCGANDSDKGCLLEINLEEHIFLSVAIQHFNWLDPRLIFPPTMLFNEYSQGWRN